MKWITTLDLWLFKKFEKFAHAFQLTTGHTNFFLARGAIGITVGLMCIMIYSSVYIEYDRVDALLNVITIVFLYSFWKTCGEAEEEYLASRNALPRLTRVAFLPIMVCIRILLLFDGMVRLLIHFLGLAAEAEKIIYHDTANSIVPFAILIFFYFAAVKPLPPGELRALELAGQHINT